jgi:hypothetical protein
VAAIEITGSAGDPKLAAMRHTAAFTARDRRLYVVAFNANIAILRVVRNDIVRLY